MSRASLGLKSGKCEFSVVSFSPYRLPKQVWGVKTLYKNVIIHREINFHEACKVLAGEKSALTKITLCFLWGFVMGKTQGASECRGDQGTGGRVQPPAQGQRGWFCGSWRGKKDFCVFRQWFIYSHFHEVIYNVCFWRRSVFIKSIYCSFAFLLKKVYCGNTPFLCAFQPGDREKWVF